jgi:hypothetical protein
VIVYTNRVTNLYATSARCIRMLVPTSSSFPRFSLVTILTAPLPPGLKIHTRLLLRHVARLFLFILSLRHFPRPQTTHSKARLCRNLRSLQRPPPLRSSIKHHLRRCTTSIPAPPLRCHVTLSTAGHRLTWKRLIASSKIRHRRQ